MCTHSWRVCVWLLGWAGQQGRGGVGGGGEGTRSTAPYCQPAVAACEALLTVPSKSHLLTHTHTEEASALPRTSLVPLVVSLFFALFFKSGPRPPAGVLSVR